MKLLPSIDHPGLTAVYLTPLLHGPCETLATDPRLHSTADQLRHVRRMLEP